MFQVISVICQDSLLLASLKKYKNAHQKVYSVLSRTKLRQMFGFLMCRKNKTFKNENTN